MKTASFRVRIALLSSLISGVVLVGFAITSYVMISHQKVEGLDTEIRSLPKRIPGWLAGRQDHQRIEAALASLLSQGGNKEIILAIRSEEGAILHQSAGWPETLQPTTITGTPPQAASSPPGQAPSNDEGGWRGGRGRTGDQPGPGRGMGQGGNRIDFTTLPYGLQTITTASGAWRVGLIDTASTTLIIGINTNQMRTELRQLRLGLLLVLPLALLLIALGGWLVAGQALRPMRTIANTAEQITASGLDQRIPQSGKDSEMARVIQVLNRMMDRLETSFRQATRFSADASHELQTPLAIMQGELEQAIQEAPSGSREQQTLGNLLEETQRLKTITRGLLMLARADAGQLKPACETLEPAALIESLIDDARLLAADSDLEFEVQLTTTPAIEADPGLLRTALLNLLVNAVKYNEPGGRVRVKLESAPHQLVIAIGNSGPGIPAADQNLVFSRFHRADASRQRQVDGIGLGLSLAREIVRAHGGELILRESRPGWTDFQMTLKTE